MKKIAAKIVGVVLVGCFLLGYVNHVFTIKDDDGIYSMTKFYELEENTVDVLVLGSSHAYMSFNTGVLWRQQGISSYVLAASAQPLWSTYYYMKEALKTQTPELIVLEGYRVLEEKEFVSAGFAMKSIYGMKWSENRLEAIETGVPREERLGVLLGYTQYHDRYDELSEEDFTVSKKAEKYRDWKGFEFGMTTDPEEEPDVWEETESVELAEKTEKYYRAILELAKEQGIPIMVVIAPYGGAVRRDQMMFHTAEKIAQEYQVPFLNYNVLRDEMPIDYATDMLNKSHLNGRGSCKFTSKWGEYIAGHYEMTDHRGDPAYESWERNAVYLEALMDDVKLRETADVKKLPEYIAQGRYDIFLSVDGYCLGDEEPVKGVLAKLGISDANGGGLWYVAGGEDIVWRSGDGENSQYFETERHDFGLERARMEDGRYENVIVIDNQKYQVVKNGINVVVFDTITGEIADVFGVNADNEYQLCR